MPTDTTFLQSDPVLALAVAVLIFLVTIVLVVKHWIGFSVACLLLLFSLAAGLLINHQQSFHYYVASSPSVTSLTPAETSTEIFQKQLLQAVEELQREIKVEKENLQHVMKQIQDIFDSLDTQKQKLQNFIEETRQKFKKEDSSKETTSEPVANSDEEETSQEPLSVAAY